MKLEALDAFLFNESLGFARAHLALVRVDAGKGHHHVAVLARSLRDLFVRDAATPKLGLAVDGEHHQTDILFAVVRDRLGDRRSAIGAEVLVGCAVVFLAIIIKRIPAAHFGVGMDVDRDQVLVFHGAGV